MTLADNAVGNAHEKNLNSKEGRMTSRFKGLFKFPSSVHLNFRGMIIASFEWYLGWIKKSKINHVFKLNKGPIFQKKQTNKEITKIEKK